MASSANAGASGAIASAATIPDVEPVHYTAAQAARLADCTLSQLRYWSRTGLVGPSAPDHRYEFRDLVALRIVRALLDAGLTSSRVRTAVLTVREQGDDLASIRLVTDGSRVWICYDDGQILDALRSGQLALFVAVDRVASDVEQLRADAR